MLALILFVLTCCSCIYPTSSQEGYSVLTLEQIEQTPCHEPGVTLDTGVRGRPDYTIDWYLCVQLNGANVVDGACKKCKCQWTLYYETAKRCFPDQFGSDRFAVYEERVEKQRQAWVEMGNEFCQKAPAERYVLNPTDPQINKYPYCAPAATTAFQLHFIIGFPAIMVTWLSLNI